MRKQELKEAFSKLHASDDVVTEVLDLNKNNKGHARHIWVRVAAAAAAVALVIGLAALWPKGEEPGAQLGTPTEGTTVATEPSATMQKTFFAAPGILKLYSPNKESITQEELEKCEITDVIGNYGRHWIEELDSYHGIRLTFCLPDEFYEGMEMMFKLEASFGEFLVKSEEPGKRVSVGKTAEIGVGEIVAWRPEGDLQNLKESIDPGEIYLHVTIYANERVVGYGIIEMASNYILDRSFYAVTLRRFRTVCYPTVDGEYQTVTEEYIWQQIEECEQAMREECEEWRTEKIKEQEGRDSDGMK